MREEDHHPALELGYRHCRLLYTTHKFGARSEKIDVLLESLIR